MYDHVHMPCEEKYVHPGMIESEMELSEYSYNSV